MRGYVEGNDKNTVELQRVDGGLHCYIKLESAGSC